MTTKSRNETQRRPASFGKGNNFQVHPIAAGVPAMVIWACPWDEWPKSQSTCLTI